MEENLNITQTEGSNNEPAKGATTPEPVLGDTQAQDVQPDTSKTLLGESKADEPKKEQVEQEQEKKPEVPEKYEFKLKEGFTLDDNVMSEFTNIIGKEGLGLSQEQGQKLLDYYQDLQLKSQEKTIADFEKQKEDWKKESLEKLGANFQEHLKYSALLLDKFEGGKEVREMLETTGLGNRIEFINFFNNIGKQFSEGSPLQQSNGEVSLPVNRALFPQFKT